MASGRRKGAEKAKKHVAKTFLHVFSRSKKSPTFGDTAAPPPKLANGRFFALARLLCDKGLAAVLQVQGAKGCGVCGFFAIFASTERVLGDTQCLGLDTE